MKKVAIIILMLVITFFANSNSASASREQAVANALVVLRLQKHSGYSQKGGASEFMYEGQSFDTYVDLRAGVKYIFVGAGCDDAYDVDVFVANKHGDVLEYDDDSDAAVVKFVAPYTGRYLVRVTLASAKYDGAHVFLLVGFK